MATVSTTSGSRKSTSLSPEILDRKPPSNPDAERGVLGSILLLPEVCDDVAVVLRPDDFYDEANQKLYEHMLTIHNEGRHVDIALLHDRLEQSGDIDRVGGTVYLAEVCQAVPTAANAVHYARIVYDKAILRKLITAGTEILRDAYEPSTEPRKVLGQAEEKVFAILESKSAGETMPINDVLHQTMIRIEARMKRQGGLNGVPTGFTDLDRQLGGMQGSQLFILAARPSMGKTALALNIAANVARENIPVLVFSLEMGCLELGDRLLCAEAEVNGHRMRNGTLSSGDQSKLTTAGSTVSRLPLFVDDSPSRTITEIAATARRLKRKQGLGLIVIDYLQLIEPDNSRDPRQEQVAKIARRLKLVCRELDVPVLCLAQLNRQVEASREGNRPKLSHLRESGAIEQDADVVMFIHREEYYKQDEQDRDDVTGKAMVIVAKQRNGPAPVDVPMVWRREYMKFVDAAPYETHEDLAASFGNSPDPGDSPF